MIMRTNLRWVYPTPDKPFRQWIWRKLHPRRVRRFERYLRSRLIAGYEQALRDHGMIP